jgi:hypothetical protein
LRAAFASGRPRTIDAVIKEFPEPIRPLVVRALHWLVKIGLLQIAAPSGAVQREPLTPGQPNQAR